MGLGDIFSNVVTRYKADTSDARREVKRLRGEQKAQAKQVLDDLESQNAKIDGHIAKWGKIIGVVGGVTAAVAALKVGFEAYAKDAQLRLAATGADIGGLQKATQGLIAEQRILEFAAANANTQFKLSAEELEVVAKGAITLRNQGNDLGDTFDRLQKAIVEGSTEPLKELGITIKANSGTMEASREIVERLRNENALLGSDTELSTDRISRAGVSLEDTFRDLKIEMGKVAVELTPVIEGFAQLLAGAADLISFLRQNSGYLRRFAIGNAAAFLDAFDAADAKDRAAGDAARRRFRPDLDPGIVPTDTGIQFGPFDSPAARSPRRSSARGRKTVAVDLSPIFQALQDGAESITALTQDGLPAGLQAIGDIADAPRREGVRKFKEELAETGRELDKLELSLRTGLPETLRIANEQLREMELLAKQNSLAFRGLSAVMDIFQGASQGAFDAWVSGSATMREALDQLAANFLRSIASQMFAKALFHGASAIGALAIGGPFAGATAAQHGKAAALFGAGAAVVGGVARAYGGGGSGGAIPATAGLGGAAAGAGNGGGTNQTIVVLGRQFGADDRRRDADEVAAALRRSEQYGGRGRAVEYV